MNNHKSSDVRKLAIEYYIQRNVSQKEISNIFKISVRTFRYWLKQYNENNTLKRKIRVEIQ